MRFSKVFSFLNSFVPEIKNTSDGIYNYGKDNQLPNQLMKYILDSGISRRCVTKIKTYIHSDGFVDKELNDFLVSENQTALELLIEAAGYVAYFNGCAFHISRKAGGGIASVKVVPFQCVRRRLDGNFEVNLTYGQPDFKKSERKIYAAYGGLNITPTELATQLANEEIRDNGEILYMYLPTADNQQYPVPDYYAGIEDIRTAAELQKFDLESVINGFVTSSVLTMIGDIDNTIEDDKGRTEKWYFDQELKRFTGGEKDANGLSGRMKMLVLNAPTKDEVPVLQPFDSKVIMDASIAKREMIERAVCRLFGVHPALMGFADAQILGNTQSMANASLELNKVVDAHQRLLEEAFKMMFPVNTENGWKITEYTPISYVSAELMGKMTEDEIRTKLLGLPPIEREVPSQQEKTLATLNSLSPLLAAEIVRNMPKKDLLALVGIEYVEPQTPENVTE